jgi:serine protease AprX
MARKNSIQKSRKNADLTSRQPGQTPKEPDPAGKPADPTPTQASPPPQPAEAAKQPDPAPKQPDPTPKPPDATPNQTDPRDELRRDMMRGLITEPLLSQIKDNPKNTYSIIISVNEQFQDGTERARDLIESFLRTVTPPVTLGRKASNYVFASLTGEQILDLAKRYLEEVKKMGGRWKSPIYRVWQDSKITSCLTKSISTVKADACHRAFNSVGEGIVWAVLDSGIDSEHPHFAGGTIQKDLGQDFTDVNGDPHKDDFGHGTHVAGIIAGSWKADQKQDVVATEVMSDDGESTEVRRDSLQAISGIAPKARLVSMKVLDANGAGKVSSVLLAIEEIQKLNQFGRRLKIHGVNLSLGYDFNPRWFGCGQSPLCVEVDRLVRDGVAVVIAAGNSGFSSLNRTAQGTNEFGYRGLSINDPGNAELAITVGATHRDMPHTYGVSFFSSRGPTGDGRLKPDLVAPGERIVSCAAGSILRDMESRVPAGPKVLYLEQTGTSMAAPHVSGAIAAFLSVRTEFIGQPEKVKGLFLDNAIDLQRERAFQGHGLLDLLKVLQAV